MGLLHDGEWEPDATRDQYEDDTVDAAVGAGTYDHLWPYARDVYATPGVAATCDMDHVTAHYYRSHVDLHPTGIVPVGPAADWTASQDRAAPAGDTSETA